MKLFWKTVLLTTLLVGINDLLYNYIMQFIKTGKFADKMLYYIAGGGIGLETSMQGGFWIGFVGLFFHFFISFAFTLLVFIVFPILRMQKINIWLILILGILYTPFVDLFMHFIVLPLTRLPAPKPIVIQKALFGWTVVGIVFGLPIFVSAYWYYRKKKPVTVSLKNPS